MLRAMSTDGERGEGVERWVAHLRDGRGIDVVLSLSAQGLVVDIDAEGRTSVREHGGPRHERGRAVNERAATVRAWDLHTRLDLHEELLDALRVAGAPDLAAFHLQTDERPTTVELTRDGDRLQLWLTDRLLERTKRLAHAIGGLVGVALSAAEHAPSREVPNPELAEWDREPRRSR